MISRKPAYYREFVCTAADCRDNCCRGGWQIGIDEETVAYYRQVKGAFGEELRAAIDCTDEYCFRQADGACPLLDANGLCRVYQELGEEHMGVVCAQFPRFSEYYGSVKETGIGMACEEAARIILSTDAWTLVDEVLSEEEYDDPEFDEQLYRSLCTLREKLWQAISLPDADDKAQLTMLLTTADAAQQYINDNDADRLEEYVSALVPEVMLAQAKSYAGEQLTFAEQAEALEEVWNAYYDLDCLNEEWETLRDEASASHHPNKTAQMLQPYLTRLLNYYIFRYIAPVSYDHNLLGAAQFISTNMVILQELCGYAYERNGNALTEEEFAHILHVFSREVEYSTENIEILYDAFMFSDCFAPEALKQLVACL